MVKVILIMNHDSLERASVWCDLICLIPKEVASCRLVLLYGITDYIYHRIIMHQHLRSVQQDGALLYPFGSATCTASNLK